MADEDKKQLASLRQRIQARLVESRVKSKRRERKSKDEIVVQVSTNTQQLEDDFEDSLEGDRYIKLASTLVMIGAIMGIISGVLILQGNPSGLLNSSLFKSNDSLDLHGMVLDENGDPIINVTIELIDPNTNLKVKDTKTDSNGRYTIENVAVKEYELKVSKEGFESVILKFKPEPIGISPITLLEGEGQRIKDELSETEGWSMENAVALATVEGLFTIGCALVGVHASFEIKRKKRYRRTQALCWVGLFSRGLIIFGPALILFSMVLIMFSKEDFEDQKLLEDL